MPHILPTSANETISEEIGDYHPVFYNAFGRSAQSVQLSYERDRLAVLFFTIYGQKHRFFSRYFQYFMFMTDLVVCKISGDFLSLSSKTNACTRKDLYNSKQYRFCPHAPLQSPQIESSSEGL